MNNTQKIFFSTCNDKTPKCELTRSELCQKLKDHYTVRVLLSKYIRRQLPFKGKDGLWKGGLCYGKLQSLKDGKYCMNPKALLIRGDKDQNQLLQFIEYMTKDSCEGAGGYYMELKEIEKKSLIESGNRFNLLYMEFTLKIQNDYKMLLVELMGILDILESELMVSNYALNELSQKALDIVKDARIKCEENYRGAIVALYQADLVRTREILKSEDKLAEMLKAKLDAK
tara:strand:- start:187 stop:870 length:684 start_codon:yes stop_codon:yes gene_type:complete